MKKYLLLVFVCFAAFSAQAQDLTIDDTEIYVVEPDVTVNPIKGKTYVHNNTNDTRTYVWTRNIISKPTEWEIEICDNNLCYFATVGTAPVDLAPGVDGLISVQVNPNNVDGEAEVRMNVVDDANAESTVDAVFYFTVGTVSTDDLEVRTIKAFPNPVNDIFNITDSQNGIAQVSIFNIIGRSLKTYNANPNGQYNVSDLATGLYLVQLKDAQGAIIRTIRMNKN